MMTKILAKAYLWFVLALLYSPILIIMIFSFTEAKVLGNWTGFSTKLYSSLFSGGMHHSLVNAIWNTFAIAMLAASISTMLGSIAAIGIYNTLQKMDKSLIEAAQDLGANPLKVFNKVILPLSAPGIVSGIVMVFMPTVSTFAIAELLTMNNIKLFGTTVQENIYNGMWNYGAALSLIMLLLIGIMSLFTSDEDSAQNESGGVI